MANEKRLIDANMAEEVIRHEADVCNSGFTRNVLEWVGARIESIPTVDAVEVVHGRWIDEDEGDWRCSVCRKLYTFDDYGDLHPLDDCGYNYCPNCGARIASG